jgi:hypothetical protein
MNYQQLKMLDREDAIKIITPEGFKIDTKSLNLFPTLPEVIVFGGEYWKTNDLIANFIIEYVQPINEIDICEFLQEIAYKISSDDTLSSSELRKNVHIDYSIIFDQYNRMLRRNPDTLFDWAESKATFIWFEYILLKRREQQFKKILKVQDNEALSEISARIKQIYNFSDIEMIYLKYFCSQAKVDDLDASLNTFIYLWSKEKFTGKTTVSEYICSFLNGESSKNCESHKSELKRELQLERFDIPNAISSRCTLLDEAGFHDMTKTYDKLKSMITSNSCSIEYKYKNSKRTKKCFRNYIMSSNNDPIWFVKDESERRILSIHFNRPEQTSFEELEKIWYQFVLECNYSTKKLEAIYHEIIMPNSQSGDVKHLMTELGDILSHEKISGCNTLGYFSVSNIMLFPEIIAQKIPRNIVKDVLIRLYGQPDSSQRFYKLRRVNADLQDIQKEIELPF